MSQCSLTPKILPVDDGHRDDHGAPRYYYRCSLRYLRRFEELPDITDNLFVVSRNDTFLGNLSLSKMLTSSPSTTVREVMNTEVEAIHVNLTDSDVAQLFQRQDLVSAPVIDDKHRLVGRITIDDVVDVIVEDADHCLLALAGLVTPRIPSPRYGRTAPRRALWLGSTCLLRFSPHRRSACLRRLWKKLSHWRSLCQLSPAWVAWPAAKL